MAKNPVMQNNIFVDADALVAISDANDSNHKKAINLATFLKEKDFGLYISSFAFGEAITVTSQNVSLKKAVELGKDIKSGMCSVVDTNSSHLNKAFIRFSQQASKNSRFTDMVNMVLMDEFKIKIIFSFDNHYPQNGYQFLKAEE